MCRDEELREFLRGTYLTEDMTEGHESGFVLEIQTGSAKHRVEMARQVQYELYVIGEVARRIYYVLSEDKKLRSSD